MMEMAQVGVQTRARALALAAAAAAAASAATPRKRKVKNQELIVSTSYIELRSSSRTRRRVVINNTPENSISVSPEVISGHRTVFQSRCSSTSSDQASASCCSSNGSCHDHERFKNKFSDLEDGSVEVETSAEEERRRKETTPSSQLRQELLDELDSTARTLSPEVSTRLRSATEKMPTESELEEFFTEAEKNIQKQFADKYNFDIIKDEPLTGRYEWVQLKP